MSRKLTPEGEAGSYCYLTEVSPKDKPWDKHRANADKVSKLYAEAGYDKYSDRMNDCSQWLEFAVKTEETGESKLKLHKAWFCRNRHCPICQFRRSKVWRARFLKALPKLLTDYPSARFVFLTLTIRNCPLEELRSTVKAMNDGWTRLSQRKGFPALGFIRSLEVTRNTGTDEAHPHLHCLLMVQPGYFTGHSYISQERWRLLWQSCLRVDYLPVVHVRSVKPKPSDLKANPDGAMYRSICETLKYTVKPEDLTHSAEWLGELTRQLHKTRAVAVGGVLKGYFSEAEPEDLIHTDLDEEEITEEDIKLIFDWTAYIKRYTKRK